MIFVIIIVSAVSTHSKRGINRAVAPLIRAQIAIICVAFLIVAVVVLQPPAAFLLGVSFPGFSPLVVLDMADHPAVCALIHSRTAPTFHAVTLSDNLNGLGKVPAATLRHSVGAENGNGAGVVGRLGLWTSCASRMKALSGIKSNDGIAAIGFCC